MLNVGSPQAFDRCRQFREEAAKGKVERLPGRREAQTPATFLKKFESKVFGQLGNPTADGAMGQGETVCGQPDGAETSRRLERSQIIQ
ncbi:hypothetical protein MesoLj131a_67400 (plasmid) [Mesorhizobium sp. 131-2-1]|nr:hypothetical protein MesoLj131a_67400 [Mesorhizobium sp. 131-2-1]